MALRPEMDTLPYDELKRLVAWAKPPDKLVIKPHEKILRICKRRLRDKIYEKLGKDIAPIVQEFLLGPCISRTAPSRSATDTFNCIEAISDQMSFSECDACGIDINIGEEYICVPDLFNNLDPNAYDLLCISCYAYINIHGYYAGDGYKPFYGPMGIYTEDIALRHFRACMLNISHIPPESIYLDKEQRHRKPQIDEELNAEITSFSVLNG